MTLRGRRLLRNRSSTFLVSTILLVMLVVAPSVLLRKSDVRGRVVQFRRGGMSRRGVGEPKDGWVGLC